MADTSIFLLAEKWVREVGLPRLFNQRFKKELLPIGWKSDGSTAKHEFDAVSQDQTIVASVKASSGRTHGGRNPAGKISTANAELLFLSLVRAPRRILVLTDPHFFAIFRKQSDGKVPPGVQVLRIQLPLRILNRLRKAERRTSSEVSPAT